jgi:hypothetical protein
LRAKDKQTKIIDFIRLSGIVCFETWKTRLFEFVLFLTTKEQGMKNRNGKKPKAQNCINDTPPVNKDKKKRILIAGFPDNKVRPVTEHLDWKKVIVSHVGVTALDKAMASGYDFVILYGGEIDDKQISAVHKEQADHHGHTVVVHNNNERRTGWKAPGLAFTSIRDVGKHLDMTLR